MKSSLIIVTAVLLTACSTSEARDREALMELIEKQARLPDGARPLAEYARYYAPGGKGEIAAVFLIPVTDEIGPGEACEELQADFTTREVPCEPMRAAWEIPAGQRRWMDDQRDLPFINDGGCSQVTLTFDIAKSAVKNVECNGRA